MYWLHPSGKSLVYFNSVCLCENNGIKLVQNTNQYDYCEEYELRPQQAFENTGFTQYNKIQ